MGNLSVTTAKSRKYNLPRSFALITLMLSVGTVAAGCTVSPEPFAESESVGFGADKLSRATENQEPIVGSLDLYEAMARALKYNLDTKVEIAETALKLGDAKLANFAMLPKLVANSGYAGRSTPDNSNASTRDTDIYTADLTFSWNILDFGLSYVRAKQTADKALIQNEMKRKIVNRTIEDVRTAYWRAVSYERLVARMRALEGRVAKALRETRVLSASSEASPLVALTYERELIEVKREIETLEGELKIAKSQLAALINVRPGTTFTLDVPKRRNTKLGLPRDGEALYTIAAANRPEMREVAYQLRINESEVNSALLELLPSFNLYAGLNYDSNEFIATNDWISWGSKVSWNLLRLTSMPTIMERNKAQTAALDQRALSVAMAIMTQVNISLVRHAHLQKSFRTASALSNVQHRILKQVRTETAAAVASEQILIREEMNTLVADAKLDMVYADLQNAYANVYASLGIDPYPAGLNTAEPVDIIAARLRDMWTEGATAPNLIVAKADIVPVPIKATR
jgi:outer membrane protein TolC